MRREPTFKSESELCTAFIEWARRQGWTAYAETAGWDIVLVDAGGQQFGIHAKLRLNLEVIGQAMPRGDGDRGPDYRGVLVPDATRIPFDLCKAFGLALFYASSYRDGFHPDIKVALDQCWWNPVKRCELPRYVPDVAAGASSPIQLTDWKVRALKACALLEKQGHITAKEIRGLGMDPRRWVNPRTGWLKPLSDGRFARGDGLGFDQQHPVVYAQIKAEMEAPA